jgi:hypothetical protein
VGFVLSEFIVAMVDPEMLLVPKVDKSIAAAPSIAVYDAPGIDSPADDGL